MSFSADDGTQSGITINTGYGLWGDTQTQTGVVGSSSTGVGVTGTSNDGVGVRGDSAISVGVIGRSQGDSGVRGISNSTATLNLTIAGVLGESYGGGTEPSTGYGVGVLGRSGGGNGVYGASTLNAGVYGHSYGTGIDPTRTAGVYGLSEHGPAGVYGECVNGIVGVYGRSNYAPGVFGHSSYAEGVLGVGNNFGVRGRCYSGHGVLGESEAGAGIYASRVRLPGPEAYLALRDLAGAFLGDVYVSGSLKKAGGGSYIDHPLDPSHKYLSHSFVESSDMKNIYDGVAQLDQQGEVVVELPEWFEALNQDFRYQLTSMGAPGPTLHVAEEIAHHRFKIAGGQPGMKVSWQVTGVRRDAWAEANRIEVETEKPEAESGRYLHPQLYGQSESEESAFQARYRLPVRVVDLQQKSEEVQKLITEMQEKAEEMREQGPSR